MAVVTGDDILTTQEESRRIGLELVAAQIDLAIETLRHAGLTCDQNLIPGDLERATRAYRKALESLVRLQLTHAQRAAIDERFARLRDQLLRLSHARGNAPLPSSLRTTRIFVSGSRRIH